MKKIVVLITKSNGWYHEGETHPVRNRVVFTYGDKEPHFEVKKGFYGIALSDCEILTEKNYETNIK